MTSSRYKWFRVIAVMLPLVVGTVAMVAILFHQGRLVIVEGTLSWRRPPLYLQEPGYETTGHRYLYDATLGWRNIPNWQATTFQQPLTINSRGLRDREHVFEKPVGTKRILVLGDSYAWGYGVADREVFADVMERNLDTLGTWEVLNTGVSGWGTDQQYLFLREEGLRYDPDVVVLAFFIGNDIDNNSAANQYTLNKPVFVDTDLTLGNVPVPRPGRAIDPAVLKKVVQLDGIDLTVRIIGAMRDACAERGCEFVLMKFGVFLAPQLPFARNLERQFVVRKDQLEPPVRYLDLDDAFAQHSLDVRQLTEGVDDGHWNAFGHRKVAELLQEFLSNEQLLAP